MAEQRCGAPLAARATNTTIRRAPPTASRSEAPRRRGSGKSKLQVKGKGANLPMPTPVSGTRFFAQTTAVIAQLREANGDCYETSFTDADTEERRRAVQGEEVGLRSGTRDARLGRFTIRPRWRWVRR